MESIFDRSIPSKHYNLIVYIGRFQPPTNAHIDTISYALQYSDRVLILAGSANQPRTTKNPWTVEEREAMIHKCFPQDSYRIEVAGIEDKIYNDQLWAREVQRHVGWGQPLDVKIGIIGHSKDESSYYLQMFPQWEFLEMENIDGLNATDIRNFYFDKTFLRLHGFSSIADKIPQNLFEFLVEFKKTEEYKILVEEFEFVQTYRKQWEKVPYPVIFTTTDAVVVQSGHILLVQRKAAPGYGLWALPGGFLEYDEYVVDSMIRELREETKLRVPVPILKGSIKSKEVFDHPKRSLRGRTITHAFLIELPNGPLSKVKGGSDAAQAKWFPIAEVLNMGNQLFEDHLSIIQHFLGEV